MRKFEIIYMDGFDEVVDADTNEVIFSTKIPDSIRDFFDRTTIEPEVVDNVVNIWNENFDAITNLFSDGILDEYLLNEEKCTQEERELIVESLYNYAFKD